MLFTHSISNEDIDRINSRAHAINTEAMSELAAQFGADTTLNTTGYITAWLLSRNGALMEELVATVKSVEAILLSGV